MKSLVFSLSLAISMAIAPCAFAEMININKADVTALDKLDGIGAKKAEAIVSYRTQHGEFKALEDLKDVPGIGDKVFEKLKSNISLTDESTPAPTADADRKTAVADKAEGDKTEKEATTKTDADKTAQVTDKVDSGKTEKDTAKTDTKADVSAEKSSETDKSEKVSDKASTEVGKS